MNGKHPSTDGCAWRLADGRRKAETQVCVVGGPKGEPLNYDAVPSRFFMGIASVGSMPRDEIIRNGIKCLLQNLAGVVNSLHEG